MAELIIKTSANGPDPAWQDGDIIHAMNDLRIHDVHAQHLCHKNLIGFNGDGLRPAGSLTEMYLSKVMQYKFERISKKEMRRTNLVTLQQETLSDKPNVKGEVIDVVLYIARRLQHDKHLIFGSTGSEVWYGGRTYNSTTNIDAVWVEIEAATANLKADFGEFPWGLDDQKDHLVITVDDFDNTERGDLEASVYDDKDPDNPVMTKRRKNKVDWINLAGLTPQMIVDILDVPVVIGESVVNEGTKVDIRKTLSFTRAVVVEEKAGLGTG